VGLGSSGRGSCRGSGRSSSTPGTPFGDQEARRRATRETSAWGENSEEQAAPAVRTAAPPPRRVTGSPQPPAAPLACLRPPPAARCTAHCHRLHQLLVAPRLDHARTAWRLGQALRSASWARRSLCSPGLCASRASACALHARARLKPCAPGPTRPCAATAPAAAA
jgi:hypothetical protein